MELGDFFDVTIIVVVLALIAYAAANLYFKARVARELMDHETPFVHESEDHSKTLLVLGDSTGVGVGAERPEHTVAGRLAEYVGATHVENYAVSGAETADLLEQIEKAKLPRYDYILVHIGGNDILAFHNAKKVAQTLNETLPVLPKAGQVLLMSAGNVGGVTMFPFVLRPFHTALNLRYHKEFERVCHAWGVTYVNLFEPFWKDAFLRDPNRYLSRDGVHPSTYGYGLWFDKMKDYVRK